MSWPPELLRTAPRIGLGLAALGRPAYITTDRQAELGPDRSVESLRQRTDEVLDAAYEAGVRYIDVARSYGLAENFLAGWLQRRGLTAAEIVVGSKWGYTYVGSWRMFDAVQTTWNLLEPSSADTLAKAHAAGMTVIVKEALANGRLTDAGDQPALVRAAAARGLSTDNLAISAALAQPWVDIVLSGAVTVETLRSNLAASAAHWDSELNELAAALAIQAPVYWDERARRSWT